MKLLGTYQTRQVFWFDYNQFNLDQLPKRDWLCLATSDAEPDDKKFVKFVRHAIESGILEFKGHGEFGEKLHDMFDETMVDIEISKNLTTIDIATTCHNNESLAEAFWECFFASTLPMRANLDNISIVCADLTGANKADKLKEILKQFVKGWMPE